MSVSELKPAPYNPRRIAPAAIAGLTKSIERFGDVQPIIWNQRSGYVVGGHQRLRVLKSKKVKQTDVVVVDLSDTEERALNVALNNPHIAGEFTGKLDELLEEIRAGNEVLFRELRLDQLLGSTEALTGITHPDDAPPLPEVAKTISGQIYELGRHRLICGDCTKPSTVAALLGSERIDSMVTDPPYGVDYVAKTAFMRKRRGGTVHRDIANDTGHDYRAWFGDFLKIVPWAEYATLYVFMSGLELHNLRLAIGDAGLTWGDYLIWVKNAPVLGRKDYNQRSEFVVFAWPETDEKPRAELIAYAWPERHRFYGGPKRNNVLEYPKPAASKLHPTMKPVELVKQLVEDGSPGGGIVYDPFAGSGSTLIACEMAGRRCRAIELDPLYCDVIVERWEQFTGFRAERHAA